MLEAEQELDGAIRAGNAQARDQRRRLGWSLATGASYAVDVLFLALFAGIGTIPAAVALCYGAAAAAIVGGTYLATLRGWNLRARDPNLTEPLVILAVALQLGVVAAAPQIGFPFLANLFTVFAFAMIWLSLRDSLVVWSLGAAGIGTVFLAAGDRIGVPVASSAERWLVWGYFSLVLGRCLLLSVNANEMRARLTESRRRLSESLDQVRLLASHDELTHALNRRSLMAALERERSRAERSGQAFSAGLIDLDHFKQVNDRFGHVTGDRVLREFAAAVRAAMRATDLFGRYGGEEFLLILVGTGADEALPALERVRAAVAAVNWQAITPGRRISFSAGVATFRKGESIAQLINRADKALYEAKGAGRDRIFAHSP